MPARAQEPQITEAAISVSEMARRLTLSRARFYELVRERVFPGPLYCVHSRRALYTSDLISQCLQVRTTNIGINGRYVLFYQPRAAVPLPSGPRQTRDRFRTIDPALSSLREGLAALGMASVGEEQISNALRSAYPSGTKGI